MAFLRPAVLYPSVEQAPTILETIPELLTVEMRAAPFTNLFMCFGATLGLVISCCEKP
jgi:hypothetical protein